MTRTYKQMTKKVGLPTDNKELRLTNDSTKYCQQMTKDLPADDKEVKPSKRWQRTETYKKNVKELRPTN